MKFVKAIVVDFWIGKVDFSHGSGLLIVPVLGPPVHTEINTMVSFPNISRQTSKRKSNMSTKFKHCRMRSNLYLKFNKQLRKLMERFVFKFVK